jgi:hypothetical protein
MRLVLVKREAKGHTRRTRIGKAFRSRTSIKAARGTVFPSQNPLHINPN